MTFDPTQKIKTQLPPGALWRILAKDNNREIKLQNEGIFDELVIDDWLHLEQMDDHTWWMRVGDARINIVVHDSGDVDVSIERNIYE